jgi:hypothetical protein
MLQKILKVVLFEKLLANRKSNKANSDIKRTCELLKNQISPVFMMLKIHKKVKIGEGNQHSEYL